MKITISIEQPDNYQTVENLTREAVWNLYIPGANEHYIINQLRQSAHFIPALSLVAKQQDQTVGHIAYSHSSVLNADGQKHPTITVGPLSVLPSLHGKGIGLSLFNHSKQLATAMGFGAIILYGYPSYYQRLGFKSASAFNIAREDGIFALALQALPLYDGALDGINGCFIQSSVFEEADADSASEAFNLFDATFPPKIKVVQASQATFMAMVEALG